MAAQAADTRARVQRMGMGLLSVDQGLAVLHAVLVQVWLGLPGCHGILRKGSFEAFHRNPLLGFWRA